MVSNYLFLVKYTGTFADSTLSSLLQIMQPNLQEDSNIGEMFVNALIQNDLFHIIKKTCTYPFSLLLVMERSLKFTR